MKSKPTPDEFWRMVLTASHPRMKMGRTLFGMIPSSPRCKLCYSPFHGLGGRLMKLIGRGPWERNPGLCRYCFSALSKMGTGGVELEVTLLFADVRGSTALAETMSPREYGELINHFFRTATDAIVKYDGVIDQLVGDEVVGLFIPAFSGPDHARRAVAAGERIVEAMSSVNGHTLPIGVGVHTGIAYVGSVGSNDTFTDFTVLGDSVNTTARLASSAAAGEILVSDAACENGHFALAGAERRELDLRGKAEPFAVSVLHR